MEFIFEQTPWELTLDALGPKDTLSALRCLSLMEDMSEDEAETALLALEERGIALDVSCLSPDAGSGETAVRLRLERQLAENGRLLEGLEENDPLRVYLEELASLPGEKDISGLVCAYRKGDESAAQRLLNATMHYAVEQACAMTGRGVLLSDLLQEGSMGLWQGILNYTEGDFTGHICWWIRQYLAKAIFLQARSAGIGQKLRQGMEDYRDADQKLLVELGRNPTVEEIADAIHVTVEEAAAYEAVLDQAKARQRVDRSRAPKEASPEDTQAVESTAYFQTRQRITELLSTLSEQEAKLLTLRFGLEGDLPRTPEQVGTVMGLTAEEVLKSEAAALSKLRQQAQ